MGRAGKMPGRVVQTTIKWEPALKQLEKTAREQLLSSIASLVWQTDSNKMNKAIIEKFVDASTRERYIQTAIIQLMCTPEYQMC
jgi:hypothetical protein